MRPDADEIALLSPTKSPVRRRQRAGARAHLRPARGEPWVSRLTFTSIVNCKPRLGRIASPGTCGFWPVACAHFREAGIVPLNPRSLFLECWSPGKYARKQGHVRARSARCERASVRVQTVGGKTRLAKDVARMEAAARPPDGPPRRAKPHGKPSTRDLVQEALRKTLSKNVLKLGEIFRQVHLATPAFPSPAYDAAQNRICPQVHMLRPSASLLRFF
eukprot:1446846-Pleurochrysis_carterae.AAC.1